jgi:hypothetical protein
MISRLRAGNESLSPFTLLPIAPPSSMLLNPVLPRGLRFTAIDVALKTIDCWLRRGRGYIAPLMKTVAKIGLTLLLTALSVAETSSRNEVVDSAGFVLKLIGHVRDCLGAPALLVVLPSSETRSRLGEFGPPAPDRVAQTIGAQA